MRQVWLQVFTVMICGSIVKSVVPNLILWIIADLVVLGVSYFLLRRHPYIDIKKSMMFIGGLTLVNILIDVNIIDALLGNIINIAIVAWVVFGGGKGKGRPTLRHKWHK